MVREGNLCLCTPYILSGHVSSSLFAQYFSFCFFQRVNTLNAVMCYGQWLLEPLFLLVCCGEGLALELVCIPVWLSCYPELAALERGCAVALQKCWVRFACGTNMLTTTYLCCFFPLSFLCNLPSVCLPVCQNKDGTLLGSCHLVSIFFPSVGKLAGLALVRGGSATSVVQLEGKEGRRRETASILQCMVKRFPSFVLCLFGSLSAVALQSFFWRRPE